MTIWQNGEGEKEGGRRFHPKAKKRYKGLAKTLIALMPEKGGREE